MRPVDIADAIKLRPGKQESLKAADPGRFEPAPLLDFLDAFGHQGDFKIGAAADDGAHNRLFWAAQVDVADNLTVNFNFVRLEAGQQRKPGLMALLNWLSPEIISFSVTSMTTCSG